MKRFYDDLPPWFLTTAALLLLGVIAATGAWRYIHREWQGKQAPQRFVTIDPVELANAERAVASKLLASHADNQAISLKLFRVGRELRGTIRQVAGPGTVVLVEQAVILGGVPDITKQVLEKLGLPLHAPTVDVTKYLTQDVAPTTASLGQIGPALAARAAKQEQSTQAAAESEAQQRSDQLLP